jgi:hypothetical protein
MSYFLNVLHIHGLALYSFPMVYAKDLSKEQRPSFLVFFLQQLIIQVLTAGSLVLRIKIQTATNNGQQFYYQS